MSGDPYTDHRYGVLRNRLGITDPSALRQVEANTTAVALALLDQEHLPGKYDLAHLADFHREIFGEIYPWAGEIRTVAIAKSDLFCLPQFIGGFATDVFGQLARDRFLRDLDRIAFVERLTHYFAEINALHPFREGNGRTQRAFLGQLAKDAGWRVDWSALDPAENITASQAALRGDNDLLRRMLDRRVT